MVVTTLNYNLVTTLLHPCNKVVISVWVVLHTTAIANLHFALGQRRILKVEGRCDDIQPIQMVKHR